MNPDKNIIIVGAGVFGLSSALHLAKRGYRRIHIYDSQPYDENRYDCSEGCVAASCDENKVIRASYGKSKLYQDLAFEAIAEWQNWNKTLAETPVGQLPPGLSPDVQLWNNCGLTRLSEHGLEAAEEETQRNFPSSLKHTQYRVSDEERREDALSDGIPREKIDPFGRLEKGLPTDGFLDMTAGFVLASRACSFALHQCQRAGVHAHLGPSNGMQSLIREGDTVTGIITSDGKPQYADLTIVACGSWTPSLLPEIEDLVESTSGSVVSLRLPQDRQDLWDKYAPSRFPVWGWNMTSYKHEKNPVAGIFGFPRTPEGIVKLCFTGAQWTNYAHKSKETGREISFPKTDAEKIPEEAIKALRSFCEENMPDLLDLEPDSLRLCWYSDSVDDSFLIDRVPKVKGLMVCNGGSGHGFKFLPTLGKHVVDVIEEKDTEYTRMFRWREVPNAKKGWVEEGPDKWQTLRRQKLVGKEQWVAAKL